MIGAVDEQGRALLDVPISDKLYGASTPVTTWIDTAFDGHLLGTGLLEQRILHIDYAKKELSLD